MGLVGQGCCCGVAKDRYRTRNLPLPPIPFPWSEDGRQKKTTKLVKTSCSSLTSDRYQPEGRVFSAKGGFGKDPVDFSGLHRGGGGKGSFISEEDRGLLVGELFRRLLVG